MLYICGLLYLLRYILFYWNVSQTFQSAMKLRQIENIEEPYPTASVFTWLNIVMCWTFRANIYKLFSDKLFYVNFGFAKKSFNLMKPGKRQEYPAVNIFWQEVFIFYKDIIIHYVWLNVPKMIVFFKKIFNIFIS